MTAAEWRADAAWCRGVAAACRRPLHEAISPVDEPEILRERDERASRHERLAALCDREAAASEAEPLAWDAYARSEAFLRMWPGRAPATAVVTDRPLHEGADTPEEAKARLAARLRATANALEAK